MQIKMALLSITGSEPCMYKRVSRELLSIKLRFLWVVHIWEGGGKSIRSLVHKQKTIPKV